MKTKPTPKRIEQLQEQVSKKFDAKTTPTQEEGGRLLAKVNELKRKGKA